MSEDTGYVPPTVAASNTDVRALIEAAVAQALAQQTAAAAAANAPVVKTPEEQARAAIDNRGVGLGVDERLAEVYALLHTLAQKVGI